MGTLCDFEVIRPTYETAQEQTLEWLLSAHKRAERAKVVCGASDEELKERLLKVACSPSHIAKRGHMVPDYLHTDWEEMQVYTLSKGVEGADLSTRSSLFEEYVDGVFESYYEKETIAPDDLIHVTCTGYSSPSGAQKIVSLKNWGELTTVTHAYHMGCYGCIPALRMARGFLEPHKKCVDIVHTEVCSLHAHPHDHRLDQFVSQSLFSDGFIRYSLKQKTQDPCLQILAVSEEIVSNSIPSMTWKVGSFGFEMTLLKEVPVFLTRALPGFLERLAKRSGYETQELLRDALFAVHPGGPKILSYVQGALELEVDQIAHSRVILKNFGNMSSATLPHIWKAMLDDEHVLPKTPLVSLAFGPGLTIAGAIMKKQDCG